LRNFSSKKTRLKISVIKSNCLNFKFSVLVGRWFLIQNFRSRFKTSLIPRHLNWWKNYSSRKINLQINPNLTTKQVVLMNKNKILTTIQEKKVVKKQKWLTCKYTENKKVDEMKSVRSNLNEIFRSAELLLPIQTPTHFEQEPYSEF
jgi:hypothetical protein